MMDFAPTPLLKAWHVASQATLLKASIQGISSKAAIRLEHAAQNRMARDALLRQGIRPEALPAAEDILDVLRRRFLDQRGTTPPKRLDD